MKPMRFPRRFPWLIVFLIAVGPVLFSVPLTIWYSFTMPPLERYYYDAISFVERPLHVFAAGRDEAGSVKGARTLRVHRASAKTLGGFRPVLP